MASTSAQGFAAKLAGSGVAFEDAGSLSLVKEFGARNHKVGAGCQMVYFGDRPAFNPVQAGMESGLGQVPIHGVMTSESRTPSVRSSAHSSSHSRSVHGRRIEHMDQQMTSSFHPSSSFMLGCHGCNFQDNELKSITTMKRVSSAPVSVDKLITEKRKWNKIYAGNVFKGSRDVLLGA